jgi:hypothetical protein
LSLNYIKYPHISKVEVLESEIIDNIYEIYLEIKKNSEETLTIQLHRLYFTYADLAKDVQDILSKYSTLGGNNV